MDVGESSHLPKNDGPLRTDGSPNQDLHDITWVVRISSHVFAVCSLEPDFHGSLNVPIEHHPTIRYMVYNGYYKVMSNIPKMGQLPTPDFW